MEVLEAPDPTLVGVAGKIVDETLNTLVLRMQDGRDRRVAKTQTVFALHAEAGRVRIEGDRIRFRPEDRIKKVR